MIKLNDKVFNGSDSTEYTEEEFEKEYVSKGFIILDEESLNRYISDVNNLIKKGLEVSALTDSEFDQIEKAKRDTTKLTRKIVLDKNGKKVTKWVKLEEVADPAHVTPTNKRYDDLNEREVLNEIARLQKESPGVANIRLKKLGAILDKFKEKKGGFKTSKQEADIHNKLNKKNTGEKVTVDSPGLVSHMNIHGKTFDVIRTRMVNMASGSYKEYTVKDGDMEYNLREDQIKKADGSLDEAWSRHQHNMKVQRQGKEASIKYIEGKYGKDIADKVREKHEKPVKDAEKRTQNNIDLALESTQEERNNKKSVTIQQKVDMASSDLKNMTVTQLREWALSNNMDNRSAFPKFKIALLKIGIDYNKIRSDNIVKQSEKHQKDLESVKVEKQPIEHIAEMIGGKVWQKGGKNRIYVEGGNNYHYHGSWYVEFSDDSLSSFEVKVYLTSGFSNKNREEYVSKHIDRIRNEVEDALNSIKSNK